MEEKKKKLDWMNNIEVIFLFLEQYHRGLNIKVYPESKQSVFGASGVVWVHSRYKVFADFLCTAGKCCLNMKSQRVHPENPSSGTINIFSKFNGNFAISFWHLGRKLTIWPVGIPRGKLFKFPKLKCFKHEYTVHRGNVSSEPKWQS